MIFAKEGQTNKGNNHNWVHLVPVTLVGEILCAKGYLIRYVQICSTSDIIMAESGLLEIGLDVFRKCLLPAIRRISVT